MQTLQTRLPRVLAEREVTPLGSEQPISVDVQLICATQRDLREMVAQVEFRLDLYYRLHSVTLELPALRDRADKCALIECLLRGAVCRSRAVPWPSTKPRAGCCCATTGRAISVRSRTCCARPWR
ncbi:sigma 54-interacting transcriptional regulator [Comamonas testosteroni]|nr:sigma 54-interacting transcriptional regulator [Comamonas testosteroni]WEE75345.1 sigma 54-interacting transcriptional regulator [Comamonas testosteroni]